MIPISTDTPIRRTPWVNYILIAVNVAIFVIPWLFSGTASGAMSPNDRLREWGALQGDMPQLYQFFSYQFFHGNFAHIAGNMLFLWVFGNAVNAKMGHGPYLLFYLAGGVFAAVGYGLIHDHSMIGASGSIAAVTTAYLALFPLSQIRLLYIYFVIGEFELPSWVMICLKLILWDNVLAPQMVGGGPGASNVAFDAHLAGYAFGFCVIAVMLATRVLPRDQFDIVALWRRWLVRRGVPLPAGKAAPARPVRSPVRQGPYARKARPVSAKEVVISDPRVDQITELRMEIVEALGHADRDRAAEKYQQLIEVDARQVLPQTQQLEVANQLVGMNRLPQAAAAYEKYLSHYASTGEADHVRLLLGIIYARDLQQYELAAEHLTQARPRITDERRLKQCEYWLQVARDHLPKPDSSSTPSQ